MEIIVYATMVFSPLVVDIAAREVFRFPKDMVVRAGAILIAASISIGMTVGAFGSPIASLSRRARILLAAIVLWTAFTALTATNRVIAVEALATLLVYIALFIGTFFVSARRESLNPVFMLMIPVAVNSVVLLLQALRIWSPFQNWISMTDRVGLMGLLGNANDIGGYLAAAVPLTLAAALASRRKLAWFAAVLCLVALVATQTRTAALAATAGIVVLVVVWSKRREVYAALMICVVMLIVLFAYAPIRERVLTSVKMSRAGDLNAALSNRLTAFTAAWEMIKDHPIVGVGPGCYGFQYFRYKIRAEVMHPSLGLSMSRSVNFADAHNDHLQIAAETGLIGYALFLAALALIARPSFRPARDDPYGQFARLAAAPTVAVLIVSALAHFPLRLASSAGLLTCIFGVTMAWSRQDEK